MKNIGKAVFAICVLTIGCLAAHAQPNTCYGSNSCISEGEAGKSTQLTAFGFAALAGSTGSYETGIGYDVLLTGGGNYDTAAGSFALYSASGDNANTAIGYQSMYDTSTGYDNSALGYLALFGNTTGYNNTAVGENSLYRNTTGDENTAVGIGSLSGNFTGSYNTAVGGTALADSGSGSYNVAMGYLAMAASEEGNFNVAVGYDSLQNDTEGNNNVAVGEGALIGNFLGSNNIALGAGAGEAINGNQYTSYGNDIDIGNSGTSTDNGVVRIGTSGQQTTFFAAGIYGVDVSGAAVYINSAGQLGVENSSLRYKKDVHAMADASEGLYRLRPVTFRYKKAFSDGSDPVEYGLIAEEVAKVYPDLVIRNANGQIQTVQYQKLVPMMLNELQKQHQLLAEQQAEIQQLQKQAAALPMLEKRLAALEAAQQPSAKLEARLGSN